jgi:tRNA (mo5U34)-methyltransferase
MAIPAVSSSSYNATGGPLRTHEQEIAELGPWFHNLHLPDGTQTAPDHPLGDFPASQWKQIAPHLTRDMSGWSVLDIGCNAGYYSFELARRGAQVLAIDVDPHCLAQARWAAKQFGFSEERVRFQEMQIYDLVREAGTYDLVWFMGALYQLRHPLLALDIVRRKCAHLMVLQTLTMPGGDQGKTIVDIDLDERAHLLDASWPKMAFVENRLRGDPTNWWLPNHACVEAMLRDSGFDVLARVEQESWLCEAHARKADEASAADAELRAATRNEMFSR